MKKKTVNKKKQTPLIVTIPADKLKVLFPRYFKNKKHLTRAELNRLAVSVINRLRKIDKLFTVKIPKIKNIEDFQAWITGSGLQKQVEDIYKLDPDKSTQRMNQLIEFGFGKFSRKPDTSKYAGINPANLPQEWQDRIAAVYDEDPGRFQKKVQKVLDEYLSSKNVK